MTSPEEPLIIGTMEISDTLFKAICQKCFKKYTVIMKNNRSQAKKERRTKLMEKLTNLKIELKDALDKVSFYLIYALTLYFDRNVPKVTFSDVHDFLQIYSDDNKFYNDFLNFVVENPDTAAILQKDIATSSDTTASDDTASSDTTASLRPFLRFFEQMEDMQPYITKLIKRKRDEPFKRLDRLLETFDLIFTSAGETRTWSYKSLFDDKDEKENDTTESTNQQNKSSPIDLSIFSTALAADAWDDGPSIDEKMNKKTFKINGRSVKAEFIHTTSVGIMDLFASFNQKPIMREFRDQIYQEKNITIIINKECYILGLIFTIYCLYCQDDEQLLDTTSIFHSMSDKELRRFVIHVFTTFEPLKSIRKMNSIESQINRLLQAERRDEVLLGLIRRVYQRMTSSERTYVNVYGHIFGVDDIQIILNSILHKIEQYYHNEKIKILRAEIERLHGIDIYNIEDRRIVLIFLFVCCMYISTIIDGTFNKKIYNEIFKVVVNNAETMVQCISVIYEKYIDLYVQLRNEGMQIEMQIDAVIRAHTTLIIEIIHKTLDESKAPKARAPAPNQTSQARPRTQERNHTSKKKDRKQTPQASAPNQTSQTSAPKPKPAPNPKPTSQASDAKQKPDPKQKPAPNPKQKPDPNPKQKPDPNPKQKPDPNPKQKPAPKPISQASVQDKSPVISKSKLKQKNIMILQRSINSDTFQRQTQDMTLAIQDLHCDSDPKKQLIPDSNDRINIAFIIYANCINFVDVKKRYFAGMNVNEVFASVIEDKYALFKCVDYIRKMMQDSCDILKQHSDFIEKIQQLNESFLDKTLLILILPAFNSKKHEFTVPKGEILNTSVKIGDRDFTYNFLCNTSMEIAIWLRFVYIDMKTVPESTPSIVSTQKIDEPDVRFFISLFIIITCLHNPNVKGNYVFLIDIMDNATEDEISQLLEGINSSLHKHLDKICKSPFETQIKTVLRILLDRDLRNQILTTLSRSIDYTKFQHDFIESIAKSGTTSDLSTQNEGITESLLHVFNPLGSDIRTFKNMFRISVTSKPTRRAIGFILTISITYAKRILGTQETQFDIFEKLIKDKIVEYVTEIYTHIPTLMKKLEEASDFESLIKVFIKDPSFFIASKVCIDLKPSRPS